MTVSSPREVAVNIWSFLKVKIMTLVKLINFLLLIFYPLIFYCLFCICFYVFCYKGFPQWLSRWRVCLQCRRYKRMATYFSSVQSLSLYNPRDCSTPGLPGHHQLPESTQTHVHQVDDAIQSSHPLLSPFPPTFNLSQHQGLFKWVSWPKHWIFSFSISLSKEYLGLIFFRMDWLDPLA